MVLSSVRSEGRDLHRLERKFMVEAIKTFHDGISHRRNTRIADHAVCLAPVQMPYRKFALILADGQHGIDEVRISFLLEDAVKRHGSPVCIPKGESSIGRISRIIMNIAVRTSVSAV